MVFIMYKKLNKDIITFGQDDEKIYFNVMIQFFFSKIKSEIDAQLSGEENYKYLIGYKDGDNGF